MNRIILPLFFILAAYSVFAQGRIVFVVDSQEPLFVEKLFIKTDRNEEAAAAIYNAILKTENLTDVFHLGDMAALGSFGWEWKKTDNFTARLKKEHISFHPVMGNHEYLPFAGMGKSEFAKRFGESCAKWYKVRINSCLFIMLNSNFSKFDDEEINRQQKFLSDTIKEGEADKTVNIIILCAHHSPYTNSRVVEPSAEVRSKFLPQFFKSPKCRLFISGHAHLFEHFKVKGKDFIVSGGGGGALQSIHNKNERPNSELSSVCSDKGVFHYLDCVVNAQGIKITVKKLNGDFKTFSDAYSFVVKK